MPVIPRLIHEVIEEEANALDLAKAAATHADQHHWDSTDPLTPDDIAAQPDLGTIGTAGVYGIEETVLGVHGLAAIGRTNIEDVNKLVKTIEADTYTVEDTDEVIICNKTTAMFVYVPATLGTGQRIYIKNINIGAVTVDCSATELMDDVETIDLAQWEYVELVSSDSGKWVIVGQTSAGGFSGDMDDIPDGTTYVKTENNLTDALVSTIGSALQSETSHADVLVDGDIGSTVQGYNANTVVDASYVHTDNNFTDALETKLNGLTSGLTQPQIMARTLGC